MFFNKKGQSILENIVTVTLVTLGIVMSWDLGTQLIGGGIKNLVSVLEEPDPNKYIRQAPPGGGIVVPGCNCSPWVEACNFQSGNKCGNNLMKAKWRTCLPAGCENNIVPPLQMLICDFSDPNCCENWSFSGLCGINAPCSTPGNNHCDIDSFCEDDYGRYQRQCQGGLENECRNFISCNYLCNNGNPRPQNTENCPSDTARLSGNTIPWTITGQTSNLCSNPPGSPPKCQTYCQSGFIFDPLTNTCIDCTSLDQWSFGVTCVCGHGYQPNPPGIYDPLSSQTIACHHRNTGSVAERTANAVCPSGFYAVGGNCSWYPSVAANNQPHWCPWGTPPNPNPVYLEYQGFIANGGTNVGWTCTRSRFNDSCGPNCSYNMMLRANVQCRVAWCTP